MPELGTDTTGAGGGSAGVLSVGDLAPDFTLEGAGPGDERGSHTLSDHRGHPVVLVFYPGDNTPVCTQQLNSYTRSIREFERVGAQVLALNPADLDSHAAFAEAEGGFGFPLLSDPDKAVAARYGVLGPLGFYRRSVFVIGPAGDVRWAHRATSGLTFRPPEEIVAAVAAAVAT